MYNGIGLQTARGSGTNGYVQRNLALVRTFKDKVNYRTEDELKKLEAQSIKGPNAEIREHARKRELELRCAEMEDILAGQGCSASEIEEKVSELRTMLVTREQAGQRSSITHKDQHGRPV
ncbi:mRNA splicing factor Cwf21 domain [Trinorchestia longiramus]|nr:mRNA splicing factor Cwf21 domain [Trinorchestia longiramus]